MSDWVAAPLAIFVVIGGAVVVAVVAALIIAGGLRLMDAFESRFGKRPVDVAAHGCMVLLLIALGVLLATGIFLELTGRG